MSSVTSKDGTKIAFDKVGSGPTVIFVNGAIAYRRAFDPTLEQLAELLGKEFTVYNYDRRGRGESGDTAPFTKEREIEDIQALVEEAGGEAMLFGVSSGAAVALETTAATPGVAKVFLYETPFIVDDGRPSVSPNYVEHLNNLVADDKRDEAVEYFLTEAVGIPAEHAAGAKQDPSWPRMIAVAHTIAYDGSFVAEFMQGKPLPTDRWANVTVPVMVAAGGDSDVWMHSGADALARILPNASRTTLPGQSHQVDPHVLAPVMIEFFKQ
jgi:pimeloyl-ACP methyl ester carboxylesterase